MTNQANSSVKNTLSFKGDRKTVKDKIKSEVNGPKVSQHRAIMVDYRNGTVEQVIEQTMERYASNGKARDLLVAVSQPMIWARENSHMRVGPLVLSRLLSLDAIHQILNRQQKEFVRMPDSVVSGIRLYLNSLSGYNPSLGADQSSTTISHHAVVESKAVEMLSGPKNKGSKKGKFVKKGGKGHKKPEEKKAVHRTTTSAIVDRVNSIQIQKNAVYEDNKIVAVEYVLLKNVEGSENPVFKSLGEARETAKSS